MKNSSENMSNERIVTVTDTVIEYEQRGDYFYPKLSLPPQTHYRIGKYGNLRLAYLKAHRPGTYTSLLTQFRLNEYLHEIDLQAKEMVRVIIDRLARERGVDEAMKAQDGLRWVQEMNNCKAAAEEIVMKKLIYR